MESVLYLPRPGFSQEADKVREALESSFTVTIAESFDDAVNLLSLQQQRLMYSHIAYVIGPEMPEHINELSRAHQTCLSVPILTYTLMKPLSSIRPRVLRAGADDCLPGRHFSADELVTTIYRRFTARLGESLQFLEWGSLIVDTVRLTMRYDGRSTVLSLNEGAVLRALILAKGNPVHALTLGSFITGVVDEPDVDTAKGVISQLRRKLRGIDTPVRIGFDADTYFIK